LWQFETRAFASAPKKWPFLVIAPFLLGEIFYEKHRSARTVSDMLNFRYSCFMDIVLITAVIASLFLVIGAAEPLAARLRLPYSAILAGLGIIIA
jgi:CPA1 family monovalent cation:H+ antiporter